MQVQETTYQDLNEYRLAWINPDVLRTQYGTWLFNSPDEAMGAIAAMQESFPSFAIWAEDREHNMVCY